MRKLILLICLLISFYAKAQIVTCKVVDSVSGQPLAFASVIFMQSKVFLYTNEKGEFIFNQDSVAANDTVHIIYLGYKDLVTRATNLVHKPVIQLMLSSNQLSSVTVANCSSVKQLKANYYRGRPSAYIGPGPETKIIIISHYFNEKKIEGYIKRISFYSDVRGKIPVRLHWYEWNDNENKPGNELTAINLLYYPQKQGWNDFAIPDKTFYYDEAGIVLGIEFIYPEENKKMLTSIKDEKAKIAWLNNISHRWSLGMNNRAGTPSFYQVNNEEMKPYKKDNDKGYNQPALRVIISVCKNTNEN